MSAIRYQVELFLLALSFFSRIPIPKATPYSPVRMNQANRYFALVGVVIGGLCALCYGVFSLLLPTSVAVMLTMVFSLLLTGAFHEDGLTDMADGIGGGMSVEKRLAIMKDSRIGTYGASALVMALLGKFVLLNELAAQHNLMLVILVAYTVSRAVAATFIFDMPYVTDSDQSKSKPLASQQSSRELMLLLATGVLTTLLLDWQMAAGLILILTVFRFLFKRWLLARIGGFTGDCLGAAQQLAEMLVYLAILAVSNLGSSFSASGNLASSHLTLSNLVLSAS